MILQLGNWQISLKSQIGKNSSVFTKLFGCLIDTFIHQIKLSLSACYFRCWTHSHVDLLTKFKYTSGSAEQPKCYRYQEALGVMALI